MHVPISGPRRPSIGTCACRGGGGDGDRPGFERGTGFLLARLGSLAARSWTALLTGHELTTGQYATLVTLKERGPSGQRRLAELVAMDARTIVPVLDALAARGRVERRAHDTDRRRIVALTDAGSALVDTIAVTAATEQDQFLRALTRTDRDDLNHLLKRLYDAHVHTIGSAELNRLDQPEQARRADGVRAGGVGGG